MALPVLSGVAEGVGVAPRCAGSASRKRWAEGAEHGVACNGAPGVDALSCPNRSSCWRLSLAGAALGGVGLTTVARSSNQRCKRGAK